MFTVTYLSRRAAIAVIAAALGLASAGGAVATSSSAAAATSTGSFSPMFADDFNGTSLNHANWAVYDNANTPKAHLASNVVVHDGMVTLETKYNSALGKWTTGGMCLCQNKALRQTYGEWEMRARVSAGDSRAVALLWPTSGWPPEVDFMEMGGQDTQGTRQLNTMTVHYGARSQNYMIHSSETGDFTQWHTIGVQWSPGVIRYLLDGQVTRTVASASVPSQQMWFGVQTSPEGGAKPTTPVNFDMDWVKEYAYNPDGSRPALVAPAVVTPPSVAFVPAAGVGADPAGGAVPVSVNWAARPGSSAICKQNLTRAVGAASPTGVRLSSATATDAVDTLVLGQAVHYTAQATGCDGAASPAATGPTRIYNVTQENGDWVSRAGTWLALSSSAFSGGTIGETYVPNGSIRFYMGHVASVALVGERGPHKGAAKVYVDGVYSTTLNNYAPVTAERRVLWTDTFSEAGPHAVTVVNVGTAGAGLGVDAMAKLTS